MDYSLFLPIIRHVLQAVGGALVTSGFLDESMSQVFVGLGMNAFTLAWWATERWLRSRSAAGGDPMDGIQ